MLKYFRTIQIAWQNGLVYRTNLLMWRLRQFLSSVMALSLWSVLFTGGNKLFAYSQSEMITYIFSVSILQSLILATTLHGISGYIYRGQLSGELLKPLRIFPFFAAQDIADKLKNFFFVILESIVLFWIFTPQLVWPQTNVLVVFFLWIIAGMIINFFITLLFGAIGFWSPDAWGPKFLFFMIVDMTAGKLFPLNILPEIVIKILYLTPLPYLSYAQTQLFLNKLDQQQIILNSLVLVFWCTALYLITRAVWRKGMKDYEANGS